MLQPVLTTTIGTLNTNKLFYDESDFFGLQSTLKHLKTRSPDHKLTTKSVFGEKQIVLG